MSHDDPYQDTNECRMADNQIDDNESLKRIWSCLVVLALWRSQHRCRNPSCHDLDSRRILPSQDTADDGPKLPHQEIDAFVEVVVVRNGDVHGFDRDEDGVNMQASVL